MITTFVLVFTVLVISAILGGYLASSNGDNASGFIGVILCVVGILGCVAVLIGGGVGGAFGFNTYTETTTNNFSKALSTDHSAVTIVYNNQPYLFNQYDVVNNFDSITNITVCERYSIFGVRGDFNIKIITPRNNRAVNLHEP
jgi:hypothetical protein